MLKPMLPLLKPKLPLILDKVAQFIPEYLEDLAKQHGVKKVTMILENQDSEGGKISVIKYMHNENGQLQFLKKEDGTPFIEPAKVLLEGLVNKALNEMNKEKQEDE